jgi:enoyl-CoA hydratase/carnithine racemase
LTTQQISQSAKPTIAAIRGYCLGGGLNLALSCDIRIAASDAKFSLPPARLGIAYPGYALANLVNTVGEQAAKYLLFTARRNNASNALQIGLVTRVIDADSFAAEVDGLAYDIAVNAPLSIKAAKVGLGLLRVSNGLLEDPEFVGLVEECYTSDDYKEGTTAFKEKRGPIFKGR